MRNLFFVFLLLVGCYDDVEPIKEPVIVEVIPQEELESEVVYNKFDNYTVSVYESGFELYYPSNMIDGIMSTYSNTSEMEAGDYMEIQFDFNETANISKIELYDYETGGFNMGFIQLKYNSIELPEYYSCNISIFSDNKVIIDIEKENIDSLTIKMYYNGSCAYGVQQSFYISEIELTEWKEF